MNFRRKAGPVVAAVARRVVVVRTRRSLTVAAEDPDTQHQHIHSSVPSTVAQTDSRA